MTRKSKFFSAIAIAAAGALMITTTAYQSKAADPTGVAAAWADYETDDDFNAISNLNTTSFGTFRYVPDGTESATIEIKSGDIQSLEAAVKGLARQVTSLGDKAKAADTALETDVTTAVASAKSDIIGESTDAATALTLAGIQKSVAGVNTAVGSLNTTVTNLKTTTTNNFATISSRLTTIENKLNNISTSGGSSGATSKSWTTAGTYTWTVPSGVTTINVTSARGGGGGGGGGGGSPLLYNSGSSYSLSGSGTMGSIGSAGNSTLIKNSAGSTIFEIQGGFGGSGGRQWSSSEDDNGNTYYWESDLSFTGIASDVPDGENGGKGGNGGKTTKKVTVRNWAGSNMTGYACGRPGSMGGSGSTASNKSVSVLPGQVLTIVVGKGGEGGEGGEGEAKKSWQTSSAYVAGVAGAKGSTGADGFINISW